MVDDESRTELVVPDFHRLLVHSVHIPLHLAGTAARPLNRHDSPDHITEEIM